MAFRSHPVLKAFEKWRQALSTLRMTSAQVVETSAHVIINSNSQDYSRPNDPTPWTLSNLVYIDFLSERSVAVFIGSLRNEDDDGYEDFI